MTDQIDGNGSSELDRVSERALELQREFDAAFAGPRALGGEELEKLVVLQVGTLQLACRVHQITRIEANRRVVPLASTTPGLMGLAGIRGRLVPVYSLATVLGLGDGRACSWLAICGASDPIAFGFDRLEKFVRAPASDLCAVSEGTETTGHMKELLRTASATHQLLDLDSLVLDIRSKLVG